MLSKRLQTTLHKKNVPLNFSGLCNLGRMQCCPRGSKQHCTEKNSDSSGNIVWTTSGHCLYTCIYQVLHIQKKYKVMPSLLWKWAETNAERVARHSTQQPVKLLVGHYLKKQNFQPARQCCRNPCNLVPQFL